MSAAEVFHLTLENRLESLREGLLPRGGLQLTTDQARWAEKTDTKRPEWIKGLNISRARAVYAYADLDTAKRIASKNTSEESAGQKMVVLSIDVDPDKVVVCDSWTLQDVYNGEDYWNTALTLDAFRRYFDVIHTEHGLSCEINEAGRGQAPFAVYLEPEVLLAGRIEPSRLEVVFTSEYPIKPTVKW